MKNAAVFAIPRFTVWALPLTGLAVIFCVWATDRQRSERERIEREAFLDAHSEFEAGDIASDESLERHTSVPADSGKFDVISPGPFYSLEPFYGEITHYEVLKQRKADTMDLHSGFGVSERHSDGPTLRVFITAGENTIVLNNFKILGGSLATVDQLMQQSTCKLPYELWRIRHSVLYD